MPRAVAVDELDRHFEVADDFNLDLVSDVE
jgi:hypothetical protein